MSSSNTPPDLGLALHAHPESLRLLVPLLGPEADYAELSPEMGWRPAPDGSLTRNAYHEGFAELSRRVPVTGHGLAYSLGTAGDDPKEAARRRQWRERLLDDHRTFGFRWFSEHLGFTSAGGRSLGLPVPLPFTQEAAAVAATRLRELQTVVPLVAFENGANLFAIGDAAWSPVFLNAVAEQADCGIMLDLHNLWCEALALGTNAFELLERIDLSRVLQIHVSGGSASEAAWLRSGRIFRLDTHDDAIPEQVFALLEHALPRCTNLGGVVVERLHGTFDEGDVPHLREELRRVRDLLSLAGSGPRSPATRGGFAALPVGQGLEQLQELLADALFAPDPMAVLSERVAELPAAAQVGLESIDPEGLRMTGLIVRKLRFERLCGGDAAIEQALDHGEAEVFHAFEAYAREVAATAIFPIDEARAYHAFWAKNPADGTRSEG